MFFTPKAKRQDTQTTAYSTNFSRISKNNTLELNHHVQSQQSIMSQQSKQSQKFWPIAKLQINVKKKKISEHQAKQQSPTLKVTPFKYKTNVCSKMSSQSHGNINAYGISSFKGHRNIVSPHFLSVNLGQLNHICFSQAFDGHTSAKLIKQQFRTQMIDLFDSLNSDDFEIVSETLRQVYKRVQFSVINKQVFSQDNSGSTLLSVIFHKKFLIAANAGSSQIICYTKNGSLLKLSDSHTTLNEKQRKRVVKNGGTIYQTVINVPFQDQLQIEGPLRISPSGLTYTRCLGKGLDYKKQILNLPDSKIVNPQQSLNITWKPQIKYLKIQEVQWICILSQELAKNCSMELIKNLIQFQFQKKSEKYTLHHIAQEASRKIIDKYLGEGFANAMSCIIVFLDQIINQYQQDPRGNVREISIEIKRKKLMREQNQNTHSLTYIGNRRSFVKSISSSKNGSKQKTFENKKNQQQPKMKKQFSFNALY